MQMKGMNVNDDVGLEKEADVMGAKAVGFELTSNKTNKKIDQDASTLQLKPEKNSTPKNDFNDKFLDAVKTGIKESSSTGKAWLGLIDNLKKGGSQETSLGDRMAGASGLTGDFFSSVSAISKDQELAKKLGLAGKFFDLPNMVAGYFDEGFGWNAKSVFKVASDGATVGEMGFTLGSLVTKNATKSLAFSGKAALFRGLGSTLFVVQGVGEMFFNFFTSNYRAQQEIRKRQYRSGFADGLAAYLFSQRVNQHTLNPMSFSGNQRIGVIASNKGVHEGYRFGSQMPDSMQGALITEASEHMQKLRANPNYDGPEQSLKLEYSTKQWSQSALKIYLQPRLSMLFGAMMQLLLEKRE